MKNHTKQSKISSLLLGIFLGVLSISSMAGILPIPTVFDIEVKKSVDQDEPVLGTQVIFKVQAINNNLSDAATNLLVKDLLPAGLEYQSHQLTAGFYNPGNGEWTISELAGNATATLTVVVKVLTLDVVCNTVELLSLDQKDETLKNNKFTVCLTPKNPETDLAVNKSVYNAVPKVGGQSLFTVTLTNLHSELPATGIEVTDQLDANLVLVEAQPSLGAYNSSTGIWSIPSLNPLQTATLLMTVTVNGSADNIARLSKLDQVDVNPDNDEGMASVTISGSSGGNDGGLESDGSLASLIADRNFSKSKTDARKTFSSSSSMVPLTSSSVKSGLVTSVSKLKSVSDLINFVPENGPFGTSAFVSTPGDLLGVSNAQEVFSADYFSTENKRMAAILGLTTTNGEVYNHTKVICDRLTGADLEFVKHVQVNKHPFIMNKLVQANGDIDYAISFIAYSEDNEWVIDNRWHKDDYQVPQMGQIYNFQIWSATPQSTVELMEEVLSRMELSQAVAYKNIDQPDVPAVIVERGNYGSGTLILDLVNPSGVEELRIKGSLTRFENAERETFDYILAVKKDLNGRHQVEIPSGSIFDIDFSIGPLEGGKKDGLYFADGPWSRDFDDQGASIFQLSREMHDGQSFAGSYQLERNARMTGSVRTYASLYRMLRPGNLPVDLSAFNQIVFDASGKGQVDLVIAKASIENWSDQYRIHLDLTADEKTFRIDLNQLKSRLNSLSMTPEDIQSITFMITGDQVNYSSFDISVKNLRFEAGDPSTNPAALKLGFGLSLYPNPMQDEGFVEFSLPAKGDLRLGLYTIAGQEVEELVNEEFAEGNHRLPISAKQAPSGVYFLRLVYNHQVETKQINLIR